MSGASFRVAAILNLRVCKLGIFEVGLVRVQGKHLIFKYFKYNLNIFRFYPELRAECVERTECWHRRTGKDKETLIFPMLFNSGVQVSIVMICFSPTLG